MKILIALSKLSKIERNRFKKFVQSPYFNSNNILSKATDIIDRYISKNQILDKKQLWKVLYPDQKYSDQKNRKLLTELISLLSKFNALEHLQSNTFLMANLGLTRLVDTENVELAYTQANKIDKIINGPSQVKNSDYYRQSFQFVSSKIEIETDLQRKNIAAKSEVIKEQTLRSSLHLDVFFVVEKLKHIISLINIGHISDGSIKLSFDDLVTEMAKNKVLKENHLIKVYTDVLLLYNDNQINVEENLEFLRVNEFHFKKRELKDVYEHYLNYYNILVNQGKTEYLQSVFSLYQIQIENGLILENGKINPTDYRNISFLAARVKKFKWALDFIEQYKLKLSKENRNTAYSFNKARVYGNMKDWNKVVETLRDVEYEDLTYNLNSKLIIMIAYFELDELIVLDSFIKSFKVFLRRRRNIPKARKEAFQGFTNVLSNVVKADDKEDPRRLVIAREELDNNPSIPNKSWLIEKIQAVEEELGVSAQ